MRIAFNVSLFVVTVAMFAFATTMIAEEPDPMAVHTDSNPPNPPPLYVLNVTGIHRTENTPTPEPTPTMTPLPTATPTPQPARVTAQWESAGALSEGEMRGLLSQAGFPEWTHGRALQVFKCESGWNPSAWNPNASTRDDSVGLAQINLYGELGPDRVAKLQSLGYAVSTVEEARVMLRDPLVNLRVAHVMSAGGQSFSAWSCAR